MPISGWIDEEDMANIYDGLLLSHFKKSNLAMYNMDGPRGYYSKWNKPDRKRQIKKFS